MNVDVVDVHHRRRRRRLFTRCRDAGDIWRANGELKKRLSHFWTVLTARVLYFDQFKGLDFHFLNIYFVEF